MERIVINEKTSLERYKELICGFKPRCNSCSQKYIKKRVEQSIKKCDKDCLTFFCCVEKKVWVCYNLEGAKNILTKTLQGAFGWTSNAININGIPTWANKN